MVAGIYGSLAQLVEHWTFNPGVSGSSPERLIFLCASGSVVEHRLAKARVASSNLVSRFLFRERVRKKRQTCVALLFLYL